MKIYTYLLIIFCCMFSFKTANAQIYFPDATQEQKWQLFSVFWGLCDTLVIKNGNSVNLCLEKYIEVFECDHNEINCNLIGYYREQNDSILLRRTVNCNEPEYVGYVFNTNVGDTVRCAFNLILSPTDERDFIVDSIKPVVYEGISRTTYFMHYYPYGSSSFSYPMEWIEGIGSTVHPFFPLSCVGGSSCELEEDVSRVHLDGHAIYFDTLSGWANYCEPTLGVENTEEVINLSVFPNPTQDFITIETPAQVTNAQLSIFNSLGKQVLAIKDYQLKTRIELSALPMGIYYLKLSNDKYSGSQKIIVSRK